VGKSIKALLIEQFQLTKKLNNKCKKLSLLKTQMIRSVKKVSCFILNNFFIFAVLNKNNI